MEQAKADFWTLGSTPCVKSFFRLSLVDGHVIDAARASTGRCGLGWKFLIQARDRDASKPSRNGILITKHTCYEIFFVPHLLATDILHLSAMIVIDGEAFDAIPISLPSAEAILLATYDSVPNFSGDINIEVQVELPTTFHRLPDITGESTRSALADSIAGGEFCDTKFCLFTGRSEKSEGVKPDILFASSSLLRHHCIVLDQILDGTNSNAETVTLGDLSKSFNYYSANYEPDSDYESDDDESGDDDDDFASLSRCRDKAHSKVKDDEKVIFILDTPFETDVHRVMQIGFEELQKLSLNAIICGLSEKNIVEELFSDFTSK
ncbi:hypothetical protein C0991_006974 [Blastosporella zonata]|nr:hypothetical protein C0991_006974 [Blastosporella zonata]